MQKGLGVYSAHCREQPKKTTARSQYECTVVSSRNTNHTNQHKRRNKMNEATISAVVAQVYTRKVQEVQTSIAISGFTQQGRLRESPLT